MNSNNKNSNNSNQLYQATVVVIVIHNIKQNIKNIKPHKQMEDYGQLDELGTLMYIPNDAKFKATLRIIEKSSGMIGVQQSKISSQVVHHPGGAVLVLGCISSSPQGSFPMNFFAPSIVTISKNDLQEMKIDIDTPRAHNSAPWPGMSQVENCPCCRKRTKVDGKTEHVLCLQSAMMKAYPKKNAFIASKMLWRVFCIACFTKISGTLATGNQEPCIKFVSDGFGAPFGDEVPGNKTVPAYQRSTSMTFSGLHLAISNDFALNFISKIMNTKHTVTTNVAAGDSQKSVLSMKPKMLLGCSNCNKTSFDVAANQGWDGKKMRALMGCSRCKKVRYCSRECQIAHWHSGHKLLCKELASQK